MEMARLKARGNTVDIEQSGEKSTCKPDFGLWYINHRLNGWMDCSLFPKSKFPRRSCFL